MATMALLGSLMAASLVSALVPVVNAEALIVAAAWAAPTEMAIAVAAIGALGQMVGKTVLFLGGRKAAEAASHGSARTRAWADRLNGRPLLARVTLFAAALVGLPPFYLMAVAAGAASISLGAFLVIGAVGRFLRFYALARIPGLF